MVDLVFGGIFTDAFSGAVAILIGSTALLGGAARYAAVLARRSEREVERATAFGFFFGIGLGLFALAMDFLGVIYTRDMAIRVALFVVPVAAVAGLVFLLNGLDAGAGVAVAAFGLVVTLSGVALGYFADRLPELSRARRPHRLVGIHHGD